jgi:hypothetical protein
MQLATNVALVVNEKEKARQKWRAFFIGRIRCGTGALDAATSYS